MPSSMTSAFSGPITGASTPPGDKSISHRSIMLGGIADGETRVAGLLEGEDVLCTIEALRKLGVSIEKRDQIWHIHGRGLTHLTPSPTTLDMGNSGTAARLLIGLLAGRPFETSFTGDASLRKRPMRRVIDPLTKAGATFVSDDGRLPLRVTGTSRPQPLVYDMPVASAQVKSAVLFAGLSADGVTVVIETVPTRDHSENMLRHFGAEIKISPHGHGGERIELRGKPHLTGHDIRVPSDPSSAAFPLVAALLHPGSDLTLRNVGLNPRRTGLITSLIEMGASIEMGQKRDVAGESMADLRIRASALRGVTVPPERAPSMIDEFPILAVAAACAEGTTHMKGLGELRVKESDRLALMAQGLEACGVKLQIEGDDLIVHGSGTPPRGGALIETAMDHRIAMSFLILGSVTTTPVTIDDGAFIATSFPNFQAEMNRLGMKIETP